MKQLNLFLLYLDFLTSSSLSVVIKVKIFQNLTLRAIQHSILLKKSNQMIQTTMQKYMNHFNV